MHTHTHSLLYTHTQHIIEEEDGATPARNEAQTYTHTYKDTHVHTLTLFYTHTHTLDYRGRGWGYARTQ